MLVVMLPACRLAPSGKKVQDHPHLGRAHAGRPPPCNHSTQSSRTLQHSMRSRPNQHTASISLTNQLVPRQIVLLHHRQAVGHPGRQSASQCAHLQGMCGEWAQHAGHAATLQLEWLKNGTQLKQLHAASRRCGVAAVHAVCCKMTLMVKSLELQINCRLPIKGRSSEIVPVRAAVPTASTCQHLAYASSPPHLHIPLLDEGEQADLLEGRPSHPRERHVDVSHQAVPWDGVVACMQEGLPGGRHRGGSTGGDGGGVVRSVARAV